MAIGSTLPVMPLKKIDADGSTSTSATRPSNCSERLRTNRGQCSVPGISDLSVDSIWQPLQMPSVNVSGRSKNAGELLAQLGIEQDRLGPALAGAEDVAVREAAAGHHAAEVLQVHAAGDQVGHVHVERLEPGAVERRRHLHLAVDALLAQDRDPRSHASLDVRCCHVVRWIVGQLREQAGIARVRGSRVLLARAIRVVAQRLHAVAGLGPRSSQFGSRRVEHLAAGGPDPHAILARDPATTCARLAETAIPQHLLHTFDVGRAYLDHRAQFLGEQGTHGRG